MKSLQELFNESVVYESKTKEPKIGKHYSDENGDMWKVEEFETYQPGDLAEESANSILDVYDYDDELSDKVNNGWYDDEVTVLVGASKGNKKKAFVWKDDEKLYSK